MSSPRFSVIMPAYNSERTILAAITSVLGQTESDLELVVVDDGSTDSTSSIVQSVTEPRLRYFRTENRGVSAARNLGIAQSRGEILTFLDSDDEAYPDWLSTLGSSLTSEDVGIAVCRLDIRPAAQPSNPPSMADSPSLHTFSGSDFLAGSFAVRRPILERAGAYDPRLRFSENTEFGMRLMAARREMGFTTARVRRPLVLYNRMGGSSGSSPVELEERLAAGRLILEKHEDSFRRDPRLAAVILAVAGVTAARLGRLGEARRFFLRAIIRYPRHLRNCGRLLISLDRRVAARVWGVAGQVGGPAQVQAETRR